MIKFEFLNVIFEKINPGNKHYIYFLFLFNLSIQILILTTLPLSLSADSFHYLQIAQDLDITKLFKVYLGNRSIGYPFFLYVLGSKSFFGATLIAFVQSILTILIPLLIFLFLDRYNHLIARFLSFFISIFPYVHYMSTQIMSETLYMFLLVACLIYFENFLKNKNVISFIYIITLFLLVSLVRPTGQLFFYLFGFTLFLILILRMIKLKLFIILSMMLFVFFKMFSFQNTDEAKSKLTFLAWRQTVVAFCSINDPLKINDIKNSQWAYTPDKANYFVIKKDKSEMDLRERSFIFKEKCLNIDNPGKNTKKYINTLIEILNDKKDISIDDGLINTLTSTLDSKGSADKKNPEYNNLKPLEIIKKVHRDYVNPLPFMHIWWRMSANIGHKDRNKIISGVIIETLTKKPETWSGHAKTLLKNMSFFHCDFASNSQNCFGPILAQSHHDMFYWRFIAHPYKDLKNQNAIHLLKINNKINLQNIYTLEKLMGDNLNHYKKDTPVWKKVEEKFYKKDYPLKGHLIEGFNLGMFSSKIMWSLNDILFHIIRFVITIFLPIMTLFYFIKKIYTKIKITEKDCLALFFGVYAYVSMFTSVFFFWDPRHIMMHFIMLLPAISIVLNKKKEF